MKSQLPVDVVSQCMDRVRLRIGIQRKLNHIFNYSAPTETTVIETYFSNVDANNKMAACTRSCNADSGWGGARLV